MQVGRDVELKSGRWRALVAPDRGGRLRWLGHVGPTGRDAWLRPLTFERGLPIGGGAVRLSAPSAVDEAHERQVPDPASFDACWQVTQQMPDRVTMMLHPGNGSPGTWGFQASQTLLLEEHRLEWTLSVRNLSRLSMLARLGWLLHLPDDFAEAAWLDDTLDAVRHLARGQAVRRDPWCGLATLSGAGGRMVLLRGEAPLDTLDVERHPTRASVRLRLMGADGERLVPLPRGEELTLRLSMDLMAPRTPPPPKARSDQSSAPSRT